VEGFGCRWEVFCCYPPVLFTRKENLSLPHYQGSTDCPLSLQLPTCSLSCCQNIFKWEMRRICFAITESRVWNKNNGEKIPNKHKGETCSIHEGLYGTFIAEQGKTQ